MQRINETIDDAQNMITEAQTVNLKLAWKKIKKLKPNQPVSFNDDEIYYLQTALWDTWGEHGLGKKSGSPSDGGNITPPQGW